MLGSSDPDYEMEHELGLGKHLDYTPLGRSPEHREGHDDTLTGWAPNRKETYYTLRSLHPPR